MKRKHTTSCMIILFIKVLLKAPREGFQLDALILYANAHQTIKPMTPAYKLVPRLIQKEKIS